VGGLEELVVDVVLDKDDGIAAAEFVRACRDAILRDQYPVCNFICLGSRMGHCFAL